MRLLCILLYRQDSEALQTGFMRTRLTPSQTLSYAAIFGIEEDLNLVGTQYSWLSSMFYFGFLVWALPTNILVRALL